MIIASLAKGTPPLSVSEVSVQFRVQIAKKLEAERTAVSASNSHGLAQIGVNKF